MKMVLIIVIAMFLTGCGIPVSSQHYETATKLCSTNNGVEYVEGMSLTDFKTRCNNGATFHSKVSNG